MFEHLEQKRKRKKYITYIFNITMTNIERGYTLDTRFMLVTMQTMTMTITVGLNRPEIVYL